jgi:hypothetical protein
MRKAYSMIVWCAAVAVLLVVFSGCAGSPQEAARPGTTEIVVIGTVHQPTEAYDGKVLYAILEGLRPGVILTESPPAFYHEDYSLRDFESSGLEIATVRRYAEKNGTELRPYDIEGRNRFYREQNWFKRSRSFLKEVRRLYREEALSSAGMDSAEEMYAAYELRDAFRDQPPRVVNSQACDRVVRIKHRVTEAAWRQLAEKEEALAEHRDYVTLNREFWHRRNRRMAANILRWAREFPGNRIVVLTGFEHAYYLRARLEKRAAEGDFNLKHHWEIIEE